MQLLSVPLQMLYALGDTPVETDCDGLAQLLDVAAKKARAHLVVDDQVIFWIIARHVVVIGGDKRLVGRSVEGLESVKDSLHLRLVFHLSKCRNRNRTLDSKTLAMRLDALKFMQCLCG